LDAELAACVQQTLPPVGCFVGGHHQFAAAFTCVAGPADGGLIAERFEAHVAHLCGHTEHAQEFVGAGPLDGDDRQLVMQVRDVDTLGRSVREQGRNGGRVGRVRDQQHFIGADQVRDHVVHHSALAGAEHMVLRLAG